MVSALALYAIIVTAWGLWAVFECRRWRKSYRAALATYAALAAPRGPTPHEKAAATRKAKQLADSRRHRLALAASIEREAAQ